MAKYNTCKYCGHPIKFLKTPTGGAMPCDPKAAYYWPREDGPDKIIAGDGVVVRCKIADKPCHDAKVGLMPHWATCLHAPKVKKSKLRKSSSYSQLSLFVKD